MLVLRQAVIVDEDYRGRGIGSEIMRRVLERCADIQYVSLNCGPDQVEFYEKLGFKSGIRMSRK
jgi:GNAT superfamily N-acetyltransferase